LKNRTLGYAQLRRKIFNPRGVISLLREMPKRCINDARALRFQAAIWLRWAKCRAASRGILLC
jgi:hypothetical protein